MKKQLNNVMTVDRNDLQRDINTKNALIQDRDRMVESCKQEGTFHLYADTLDAFHKVIDHYEAILY